MFKIYIKKYWIYILAFLIYQSILFFEKLNSTNPIPYLNFIFYFISFLIIHAALVKTDFNKVIVYLFFLFYGYLSVVVSLVLLFREVKQFSYLAYFLSEVFLSFLLTVISLYLLFYSLRLWQISDRSKLNISIFFSLILTSLNYFNYFKNPALVISGIEGPNLVLKGYITIVFSVFLMMIFWYRYYQKYFVLSEYLNTIIFLFTLFNMIQALHFIAFQWNIQIWFKSQIFNMVVNILMIITWYARLVYLNSSIANENERYLMNFQYLNGFISKPRKTNLTRFVSLFSINNFLAAFSGIILILVVLFLIHKITFYLLLNTIFILFIVLFVLFFSFLSIKRDWQGQLGVLLKKEDK